MKRATPWLALVLVAAIAGCNESQTSDTATTTTTTTTTTTETPPTSTTTTTTTPGAPGSEITTASGLQYTEVAMGTGDMAAPGKKVGVHYTVWLADGTKVDSSLDRGQPLEFVIGDPNIIKGWNEGLVGMKVGGKRKLTVPPSLGYGAGGNPPRVPPDATLKFDLELVSVATP
jgi:FKBP-type peptidyl-prolyl cis-trans isomerase